MFWGTRVGGLRIAIAGREPTEAPASPKQPVDVQDIEGIALDVFDTQGLPIPAVTATATTSGWATFPEYLNTKNEGRSVRAGARDTFGVFDDFRG
jgi:hypothetical protein